MGAALTLVSFALWHREFKEKFPKSRNKESLSPRKWEQMLTIQRGAVWAARTGSVLWASSSGHVLCVCSWEMHPVPYRPAGTCWRRRHFDFFFSWMNRVLVWKHESDRRDKTPADDLVSLRVAAAAVLLLFWLELLLSFTSILKLLLTFDPLLQSVRDDLRQLIFI